MGVVCGQSMLYEHRVRCSQLDGRNKEGIVHVIPSRASTFSDLKKYREVSYVHSFCPCFLSRSYLTFLSLQHLNLLPLFDEC